MNFQQEKRFEKLATEEFYLLDHDPDQMIFTVSGSTKNVYTVQVHHNQTIYCSCPDMRSWAKKHGCVCKHCLFILYRVLKIFHNLTHPFFSSLKFTPEEMEDIQYSTNILRSHIDDKVIDAELVRRFNELSSERKGELTRTITVDDMCAICYLSLDDGAESKDYRECPQCRNVTHTGCLNKWLDTGNTTCVYCRSKVWEKIYGYKNLSAK